MTSIETPRVLSFKAMQSGALKGYAEVEYGQTVFVDCPLFQAQDGTFSVGAPAKPNPYGGPKKFLPLVRWDKALTEAITEAVAEAHRLHPNGFRSEPDTDFRGEVRRRANLPAERPDAGRGGRYGNSGNGGRR